jgi:nucleoporin SEH1
LSLVVAAMDTVKIYRMNADRQFYHALELSGHGGLVRDVAWANGCVRGFDLIASGSSDGIVRVFEVHTEWADSGNKTTSSGADKAASRPLSGRVVGPRISTQSGIGSALANRTPTMPADRQRSGEGPFKHTFDEVAVIDTKHLDVWQVEFSHAGEFLPCSARSLGTLLGFYTN